MRTPLQGPLHDGARSVLLILTMEDAAYLQDRGRGGVQRVLHRKEERRRGGEEERRRGGVAHSLSSILRWSMRCTLRPLSRK